jgi:hypothetical protein
MVDSHQHTIDFERVKLKPKTIMKTIETGIAVLAITTVTLFITSVFVMIMLTNYVVILRFVGIACLALILTFIVGLITKKVSPSFHQKISDLID